MQPATELARRAHDLQLGMARATAARRFLESERQSIHELQHLAHERGDFGTFARLEGRLEELCEVERWLATGDDR